MELTELKNKTFSKEAEEILRDINDDTKLGDLRKIAKQIKKDHDLAMELWASEQHKARLLAILIMDKKELTEEQVNQLTEEMDIHSTDDQNNLMDWLFANQLTKSKPLTELILSWDKSPLALQRRIFWYYQGRLRWTGNTDHDNTEELLSLVEKNLEKEEPAVQWAMNFTAGWIGVYVPEYRDRCMEFGERIGLYRGDHVSRGCTPNYLPEFIEMEANKRNL